MYEQRAARRKAKQASLLAAAASGNIEIGVPVGGNGFDHEEMGMTTERQRVIQASLFKMLGQADDDEGGQKPPPADATNGPPKPV
jgi:hypothetical protein